MSELDYLTDAGTSEVLFGRMLDGHMSDIAIAELLIQIGERGETAGEIIGAARAMRARMIRVSAPANAIDVCGTGGDGSHSLNISTAVALVVAACDVPVAKHGNRAASSKSGGADTLEALGLNLERASKTAEATLADLGICFLFAQAHHPALAKLAPIRKSLGRRTIFNLLGPLCNPACVSTQLVGVPKPALIPLYAQAVNGLGINRAMIVSGTEGLDEISISGPTALTAVGFNPRMNAISPQDAGLGCHPAAAIKGGDAAFNAAALQRLLDGEAGAYRDAVLLNAAAALMVAGEVGSLRDGVEEAAEAIDKGLAKALLACWVAY
jgi:anthranilate phosphoribosyltransferase